LKLSNNLLQKKGMNMPTLARQLIDSFIKSEAASTALKEKTPA
jgi:hypothetical protein